MQIILERMASGPGLQDDNQLSILLQQSRTQSGRQLLLESGATQSLPAALKRMAHRYLADTLQSKQREMLVWLLQLARNLCAAGDAACFSLFKNGLLDDVLVMADKSMESDDSRIQKFVLQLLVNMTASSPNCLDLVWTKVFPNRLATAASASQDETAGPLCTLLLLATKDSFTRASSLCSPAAASSILSPLLLYICSSQEPTAAACTLGLLIHHVIFQQGLLQAAMTALAIQQYSETRHSGDRMRQPPSRQQIVLLQLLADELESPAGNRSADINKQDDSVQFVVYWVHSKSVLLRANNAHDDLTTQSLEAGLQVLRALTALDEPSSQQSSLVSGPKLTHMLVCTLAMLAALNPIQPPRRRSQPSKQTPAHSAQQSSSLQPKQVSKTAKHDMGPPDEAQQGVINGQSHHPLSSCQAGDLRPGNQSPPTLGSATDATPLNSAGCSQTAADQSGQFKDAAASTQRQQHRDALSTQPQSQAFDQSNESMHSTPALGQAASQGPPTQAEQQQADGGYPVGQILQQQCADSPEQLVRLAEYYPKQSPYKGYRCDLVALLANLCFRRPAVHEKVQQLGGVELILCQCQWDDENPLVREYGLWAVRNLCEGNDSVQESISSLRACSTVDSPDLQQIGMQLKLDGQTGKPRMVSRKV